MFSSRQKTIHNTIEKFHGSDAPHEVYSKLNLALMAYPHIGEHAVDEKTGQTPALHAASHVDPNPTVLRWLSDQEEHAKYGRKDKTNPRWEHKDKTGKTALIYAVNFSDMDTSDAPDKKTVEKIKRKQECIDIILSKRFPTTSIKDDESLAEFHLAIDTAIKARNVYFFQKLHDRAFQDFRDITPILERCKIILSNHELNETDLQTLMFFFQVIKKTEPAWHLPSLITLYTYIANRPQYALLRDKFLDALPASFNNILLIDDFVETQKKAIDNLNPRQLEYLCLLAAKGTSTKKVEFIRTQLLNYIFSHHRENKLTARQLIDFEKIILNNLFIKSPKESTDFKDAVQLEHLKLGSRLYRRSARHRPLFENDLIRFTRAVVKKTIEADPLNPIEAKGIIQNIIPILYEYRSNLVAIARAIMKLDDTNLMAEFISEFVKIKQRDSAYQMGPRLQQIALLNFVYSNYHQSKLDDKERDKLHKAILSTLPPEKTSTKGEEGQLKLIEAGAQLYRAFPQHKKLLTSLRSLDFFAREMASNILPQLSNLEEAKTILQVILPALVELNATSIEKAVIPALLKVNDHDLTTQFINANDSIAKALLPQVLSKLTEYQFETGFKAIVTAIVRLDDIHLAVQLVNKLIEIKPADRDLNFSGLSTYASFDRNATPTQRYLHVISLMKPEPTEDEVQRFSQAVSKCDHDHNTLKAFNGLFQFLQKHQDSFPYFQHYSDSYFHSRAARGAILTPQGKRTYLDSDAAKENKTPTAIAVTSHKSATEQLLSGALLATEHDRLFTHDEHHAKSAEVTKESKMKISKKN